MRYSRPPDDADWDDAETAETAFEVEEATVACSECGKEIYEEAERCPHCGHYVTDEAERGMGKPWWIVAGVIACLAIIYFWIFGPL